jgi:hypothetical protein
VSAAQEEREGVRHLAEAEAHIMLSDALTYYAERRTMGNPKGWGHVLRVVDSAISNGVYGGLSKQERDYCRGVIAGLAKAEG